MLVLAAALWGGSFVVLKDVFDAVPPSWLLGIRFVMAGLLMGVLFCGRIARRLDRGHLLAGVLLGLSGGSGYLVQNLGLVDTTPGHNAFLTATYCVMVPFLHWTVARVRPRWSNVAAAFLALAGVGALSLGAADGLWLSWGDGMTLFGAFWFAVQIEVMVHVASGRDVLTMTVVEFFVMGAVCLAYGMLFQPPPPPSTFASPEVWLQMGYLVLLASCLCTMFQNVGQAHVPPEQASLLLSLESVFGVLFSVVLYGETLTSSLVVGFLLVFAAILTSELAGWEASAGQGVAEQ